ncbi:hypothetical protein BC628DRAFT_255420 [Trametes gibbosa]|nr:hypothetical protein BC628DRAFT_255420 [Trametes gibbosa]
MKRRRRTKKPNGCRRPPVHSAQCTRRRRSTHATEGYSTYRHWSTWAERSLFGQGRCPHGRQRVSAADRLRSSPTNVIIAKRCPRFLTQDGRLSCGLLHHRPRTAHPAHARRCCTPTPLNDVAGGRGGVAAAVDSSGIRAVCVCVGGAAKPSEDAKVLETELSRDASLVPRGTVSSRRGGGTPSHMACALESALRRRGHGGGCMRG